MRMNIDEKWKTDPRRTKLVNLLRLKSDRPDRMADGMLVEVTWVLFSHKGGGIPLKEFKFIDNHQDWLDCELGEIVGDMVLIAGSDRYEEFFDKQAQNGSKGGRPRKNPEKPNETQNNPTEPNRKPEKPSSSGSISSSGSVSKSKAGGESAAPPANQFIGPVLPELAGNSMRDQVLSQIPLEQQQEWLERYDLTWLKDSILHAISKYAKDDPVECVKDWPEKLTRWFKIEKRPKLRSRAPPAKILEPQKPWPNGARERAMADPEIAKARTKLSL